MSNNFYIDVTLELDPKPDHDILPVYFKKHITQSLNTLFGEVGSCISVDVLKYNLEENRAILRVPAKYYAKLYSALTLCGNYEGINCAYRVHKTSPNLLSLIADSRTHQH